jgi:hypothetical protein
MTPLPLLVLEAGSGTEFLTNSINLTLWTLWVTQGTWGRVKQSSNWRSSKHPLRCTSRMGFPIPLPYKQGGASSTRKLERKGGLASFHLGWNGLHFGNGVHHVLIEGHNRLVRIPSKSGIVRVKAHEVPCVGGSTIHFMLRKT